MFIVDFEPIGRRGTCQRSQTLLDCARSLNVDIVSICGGVGSCGRCKVQIVYGKVSNLSPEEEGELTAEELSAGYRLACQVYPESDVKVHVPSESLTAPQRTQVEGLHLDVEPDPMIAWEDVDLPKPDLTHPLADDSNLWRMLGFQSGRMDYVLLQNFSRRMRELEWKFRVAMRGDEVIALSQQGRRFLGFAVDIGTTKIAGYLLELENGRTLSAKGVMNPQIAYGEDIVARIAVAARSVEDAKKMQYLLVEALNKLAADLCEEINADTTDIVDAVFVCNTAIHHLFLCLPVSQLGLSPYIPSMRAAMDIKAREIGLKFAPGAYMHLPPNVAGYVGADHVAMLLAVGIAQTEKITLAIDIGTNTEICLNNRGKLSSLSAASGPAFEGAHIKYGMRAAPGAIEHVRMCGDVLEIQTIGGESPAGLCGSGLLDVVAQMRMNNVIDKNGKMNSHPRIRREGMAEFVVAERPGKEPITISQKDIRELQLAKAAIRLGIQALIEAEGLLEDDIDLVYIAGAFGTFIDISSAITIGMLPSLPLSRFVQVGNAAGTGARLILISKTLRSEAQKIAWEDGYIELASVKNFHRQFANALYL